jgi:tRNA C32,U32 (ribose-2'-O)-methylase TrmJ
LLPSLLLAFWIWHRSPAVLPLLAGQQPQPQHSNVAHARSSMSDSSSVGRTGSWMSRVMIPRTSSAGPENKVKSDLVAPSAASASTALVEAPPVSAAAGASEGGGEQRSLSAVLLATTTVATVGAGTTTVVLRRSKQARRFVEEKQGKLRNVFKSSLQRAVRHNHDPDDVDDNRIMSKRFSFRRAKHRGGDGDDGDGDDGDSYYGADLDLEEAGTVRVPKHEYDSAAAGGRSRTPTRQVLRKKSEQDYIQDLLDRVKQNVAAPSMRRTERSIAERAAELHPSGDVVSPVGQEQANVQQKQPSNAQSVVQSLKSISSLSTATVDDDDMPESADEPSTAPFLHDVDAAYGLAFDATTRVVHLHDVDEAYAQAFRGERSIVGSSADDSVPESSDVSATAPAGGWFLHEVDEAYAKAFGRASSSMDLPVASERLDIESATVSSMSDLALIGGEISAAVLDDNVGDASGVMKISDVVEQYAATDEATDTTAEVLESPSALEEAAQQVAGEAMTLAVDDVVPTTVMPKVRVIESLESLVESPDLGVASAAADVLADVEVASDLSDELKALRKSIETTATTVDDESETTNADVAASSAIFAEHETAKSITFDSKSSLEGRPQQDAGEVTALADEDLVSTTVIPAQNVRILESLESLIESPDPGVASAAADVLADVEVASDLADELKALRKCIETTATTVDDKGEDSDPTTTMNVAATPSIVPEGNAASSGSLESSSSHEVTASQNAGEPMASMEEDTMPTTAVTPARSVKIIESLESLVESPDLGVASAAADVLADVEVASDLADELKALRKSIETTATTDDDEGEDYTTYSPVDVANSLTSVPEQRPVDENQDSAVSSLEVDSESSISFNPVDDALTSMVPETDQDVDVLPEATTVSDELVGAESTVDAVVAPADPAPAATVSGDVEPSPTNTASDTSSIDDEAESVGTFPAWIRDRVRSKRQHQRERSRTKKTKSVPDLDCQATQRSEVQEVTPVSASTILDARGHNDLKATPSETDAETILPSSFLKSASTHKHKVNKDEPSVPTLRSGAKKRKNKTIRQQPQNPADAQALSRKYAAIPSLEERAFEILKDLGMLEPLDDFES